MPRLVDPGQVEPVVGGLLGAIDVDGGPTDEQLRLLRALTTHVWDRPDLELDTTRVLTPPEVAAAIGGTDAVRRFHYLLVVLELCRHPLTAAQDERVEEYAAALSLDGMGLEFCRDLVAEGAEVARADHDRFEVNLREAQQEPSLRGRSQRDDLTDPELVEMLMAMERLPQGSLGHALMRFYAEFGLSVPGASSSELNYAFVAHDMNHVIAGYDPVAEGELALGAFQMGMNDSEVSWILCLTNLAIHEAGVIQLGDIAPKAATLARPGVADTFARALARGSRCTGDFAVADHLAMVEMPLEEVRARFGVPPVE
ncbi:MAG: hypothetical protein FGM58_05810 [Acidimicrobiia bacterium]|nr:hypothetical protein [Acidimicrobiia bacterium]